MTDDKLVEAVVRAIKAADEECLPLHLFYSRAAKAAIAAVRQHMMDDGK